MWGQWAGLAPFARVARLLGRPDQRRGGLATAALRLLVPWAFRALGLVRIEAAVAVDNSASQRVLERNGFRAEGVLRAYYEVNGVWTDMVMFALALGHRRSNATAEPCHNARRPRTTAPAPVTGQVPRPWS